MRHLLAGGGGFIGSHLAELFLARGDEVVVVDNFATGRRSNIAHLADHERFTLIEHDITSVPARFRHDRSTRSSISPARRRPSTSRRCHSRSSPSGSTGTRNLLDLAVANGARFFLASTSEVYGDPLVHPQPETYWGNVSSIGPRSCYDEAKRFSEAITMAYHRVHGLDVRIARIFNTYGERMRPEDGRVVNTFVVQALRGEPITLHGDGSQTRSFCHVADEIIGLAAVLDGHLTGPINVGNPDEFTIRQLAELVVELTGSIERDHHRAAAAGARGRSGAAPARHHPDQLGLRMEAGDRAARGSAADDHLVPRHEPERHADERARHRRRRVHRLAHRAPAAPPSATRWWCSTRWSTAIAAPSSRRSWSWATSPISTSSSSSAARRDITQVVHFAAYKSVGESMEQPSRVLAEQRRRAPWSWSRRCWLRASSDIVFSSSCSVYGNAVGGAGHRGCTHPTREHLRRVEGDDRADPRLVRRQPRVAFGEPALLQRRGRQRRQSHRRGLAPVVEPHPVGDEGNARQAPARAGVRQRLPHSRRHMHPRLHPRRRPGRRAREGARLPRCRRTIDSAQRRHGHRQQRDGSHRRHRTTDRRSVPWQQAPRRAGDPVAIFADPTLAGRVLDWQPKHDLDDIVASAWNWHSTHLAGYDESPSP